MTKSRRIQILFLFLIMFCISFAEFEKKILVLHSYHKGFLWTDNMTEGIDSVFDNRSKYELHHEYLDYKRHNDEEYIKKLTEIYKEKKRDINFDGIITTDNFALDFALEYRDELFKDVPIVFCGINDYTPSLIDGHKDITGVVEKPDHRGTLDLMLSLHPKTENIIILTDKTPTGQKIKAEILAILPEYFGRVKLEIHEDFYLEEIFQTLNQLPKRSLVYMVVINRTIDRSFVSYESVTELVKNSKVPFYASWEIYLDRGIVGGKILRGFSQGERAGNLMLKILSGTPPAKLAVEEEASGDYIFDSEELKRFQISLSKLPVNSKIINSTDGIFKQNMKLMVLALLGVSLIILVILLKIFYSKKEEKRINIKNAELEEKVKHRTNQLEIANTELKKQQEKRIKKAYKDGYIKIKIELLKDIMDIITPLEKVLNEEIDYKRLDKKREIDFFEKKILLKLQNTDLLEELNKDLKQIPDIIENIKHQKVEELKRLKFCEKEISHLKEIVRMGEDASGTMNSESFLDINKILIEIVNDYLDRREMKIETYLQPIEKLLIEKSQLEKIFSDLIRNQYEAILLSNFDEKTLYVESYNETNYAKILIYSKQTLYSEEFIENIFNLSYITNEKNRKYFELYGCFQMIKKYGGKFEVQHNEELGDMFILYLPK